MELGDSCTESDSESSTNSWPKETTGNKTRVGIVVDRNEPTAYVQQSPPLVTDNGNMNGSSISSISSTGGSTSSAILPSVNILPPHPVIIDPPPASTLPARPGEKSEDFFSNMGMGISYAAPKRAIAKKVAKPEPEPLKPSAAFTMDSLLPDTFVESGWGGDAALEIEIDVPTQKHQNKGKKSRPAFSAVELDDDVEINL